MLTFENLGVAARATGGRPATGIPHPDYGSIFIAIGKQLGLKLVPGKFRWII